MTLEVYLDKKTADKAERYFSEVALRGLEGMGLLVGMRCQNDGNDKNGGGDSGKFVMVSDFITGDTDSSPVSVKFSKSAFEKLTEQLKGKREIVVGWCHSHPSYGCFLSSTDVSTQRRFFNEEFHIAAVFDPLRTEQFGQTHAMAKRFYRLTAKGYQEISFAVTK